MDLGRKFQPVRATIPGRRDNGTLQLIGQSLASSPRSLPSLLLWDSVGLQLYDNITLSSDYYLNRVEADIIRTNIDGIVRAIGTDGIILELGSGCLSKTSIILGEFAQQHIPVTYFALDMCASSLTESLKNLRSHLNNSPHVSCHPLCMTYEGGISWVANQKFRYGKRVTVLWLGSSLANESLDEFHKLVNSITAACTGSSSMADIQFLVGVDGNKDASLVSRAYDTRDGLSRRFALNAINNVNRALGADVFDSTKWEFDGRWDPLEEAYQTGIRSIETQEMMIGGERLEVSSGEKIQLILSRKLNSKQFETWLAETSLRIMTTWKHSEFNYGLYRLVPTADLHDQ
ncbi:hypothetical protein N431DRAFT_471576 [Stipitochalara longipes BDJ]|nr:hypothetical protein N431DRAFT_471576 [Stipitochalara longipes BDJ]